MEQRSEKCTFFMLIFRKINDFHSMGFQQGNVVNEKKWPDKSTTSYDKLDFKSYTKSLTRKYLVIERHMLQTHGILLQYLF